MDNLEWWSLHLGICQQAWKQYVRRACGCILDNGATGPQVYCSHQMETLWCDTDCWEAAGSMMLGLYVPHKWHTSLPKLTDQDQLFSPLLHSSSGKVRGTVLYIQEPGGLLFRWGLVPEDDQSLCRVVCLAVSFCPCYCGYCVFPCEQHLEAPNFAQASHYTAGSWLHLFSWHLASSPLRRLKYVRCAQGLCLSTLAARSGSPVQHVAWAACVFLEFGCYSRCRCLY